ncbi:MAG: hypothetical protein ONB16_00845 [candidate division KSB1 bacterium]|nr:hypothetical protein [candidate division KSB1 bacterium]MDZ7317661.1 hypothetical protein [candidate division KSB1 bacterium]
MKKIAIWVLIFSVWWGSKAIGPIYAVDYPIVSLGGSAGWGQSSLANGLVLKGFCRYSVEAYFPGLHFEGSVVAHFNRPLDRSEQLNPDPQTERRIIETTARDIYPALSAIMQFQPFGEMTTVFAGGGVQWHFLSAAERTTDRYWDDVAQKYQETETRRVEILQAGKPGYHLMGGLRVGLSDFGSVDLELRQTFFQVAADDWLSNAARAKWGSKSWQNFSLNVGLTIHIF